MDGVPASLAAPHPNDNVADFNDQLDAQPEDGQSDSSEDSMQEEVLQSDNDDDAASSHHGDPMVPVVPKRRSDKIRPDRLRYFFWDSECSMREDTGIPPVAAAADLDAQGPPQTVDGQRLYHDPLLVMAEIACVPCIDARYGRRLSFLVVILLLNNCK
jgi:hypothetical protein